MVKTPNPFPAGEIRTADFTIWSTKKHDRGQFNVYVGTKLLVSVFPSPFFAFSLAFLSLRPDIVPS